ncbi:hypothetical protein ACFQJC_10490 [Haloferax namakaokahaiae]|uniref:Uncharacterized protein n=1 Tax=Haloferax namakaokahaiae TaxID=1748331 RepID=A0ABD5ZFU1_9EURY
MARWDALLSPILTLSGETGTPNHRPSSFLTLRADALGSALSLPVRLDERSGVPSLDR